MYSNQSTFIVQNQTDYYINFQIKYTSSHLAWINFFEPILGISPELLYLYQDKVLIFINPDQFLETRRKWQNYVKLHVHSFKHHIRIKSYSQNLTEIIGNWYQNIKNLEIQISIINKCVQITLKPPSYLRQFVIGKNGSELELLTIFLHDCVQGNYNFLLKIL